MKKLLLLIFFNQIVFSGEQRIECKLVPTPILGSYGCRTWPSLTDLCRISFPVGNTFNWAGFVACRNFATQPRNTVKQVAGSWRVPRLRPTRNHTYAAIFVGMDGFGSGNTTVEQLGTEQEFFGGQQVNYAWIQMFPSPSMMIAGFPVNIGDQIRATVTHENNNIFRLTIRNITRKVFTDFRRAAPNARRSTAQWIVEAPFNDGILPLANFGAVTFTNCTTKIAGVSGTIKNPNWQRFKLNMITRSNIVKARTTPVSANGRSFKVIWNHQ